MKKLYVIPDRQQLETSLTLRKEYQVQWEYNDFFLPDVLDDTGLQRQIIDTYAKVLDDFSQDTMHGAFLDVTLHSKDSLIRQASEKRVCQSMDIAKEMGLRGVVFHTNRIMNFREEHYLQNWQEANKAFFTRVAERYPDIDIYLENMFDESYDMLAGLAESMKSVPNFAVCFDYAHALLFGKNPGEWFRKLSPYIRHMHINDNDGSNDLHLAVGDGKTDWKAYEEVASALHVEASVLIEVKGLEKQRRSLEYMQANHIWPCVVK